MAAMFVELGSTTDVWRAHMVRGILATYGIEAVLWHENASLLYSQGWGQRCVLLVYEDDTEDAIEILRAAPESVPQLGADDAAAATGRTGIFPGIVASLQAGGIVWATLVLMEVALNFAISLCERGQVRTDPSAFDTLFAQIVSMPLLAVVWGVLVYLMLLALRLAEDVVKTLVAIIVIAFLV